MATKPMTFGLVADNDRMQTYHIKKYTGKGWAYEEIKAKDINHLRLRLIKDYSEYTPYGVNVKVKRGKAPGSPLELLGTLFSQSNGKLIWMDKKSRKHRVSKNTGGLLDYNKYWRYV